jgi:hypothetical protein
MLLTLARLDKLSLAGCIFLQIGMMEGSASSYMAMILRGEVPQPKASDDNEDDDAGPVPGPKSLSSIELPRNAGVLLDVTLLK